MRRTNITFMLALIALPLGSAFIGMGIKMYDPTCAYACRSVIASAVISCPESGSDPHSDHDMGMDMGSMNMIKKRHGDMSEITPVCRAVSVPFLTTLAYCMNSTCPQDDVGLWRLEQYWSESATGDEGVTPPMWGYWQALSKVSSPPTKDFDMEEMTLNGTMGIAQSDWSTQYRTLGLFEHLETLNARYGLVLLLVGAGTPILVSLLYRLPFATSRLQRLKPYLLYPALFKDLHHRPIFQFFNLPNRGQALYLGFFISLTVILTAVSFQSVQPNAWNPDVWYELVSYTALRTGVLGMALAPLMLLFAGRNNFLLWVTNWSHGTYLLFHRWIARLFGLQIILHSILELAIYVRRGTHAEESSKPYWVWGVVGTIAISISLVHPIFRKLAYEWFLIIHIVLAVLMLVGTWFHIYDLYENAWGYQYWLYACFAVWAFDRFLRAVWIAKNGWRNVIIRPVGNEIMRVDVPGLRWSAVPGQHAYIYFPYFRTLAPWENHPFSVVPTALLDTPETKIHQSEKYTTPPSTPGSEEKPDLDANIRAVPTPHVLLDSPSSGGHAVPEESDVGIETNGAGAAYAAFSNSGITFFIRKHAGLTAFLWKNRLDTSVLVEGPYLSVSTRPALAADRLILIAGGIGITALLPFINTHANTKLYWSMRSGTAPIVQHFNKTLEGAEKDVKIGERFDISSVLEGEVSNGWKDIGVVVCGPAGLCDEVRKQVVRVSKASGVTIDLEVDSFSW